MKPVRSMRWPRLSRLIAVRGSLLRPDYYECTMERHHALVVSQHRWWVVALGLAYLGAWRLRPWLSIQLDRVDLP